MTNSVDASLYRLETTREVKDANQLAVVRRREGTLGVKVEPDSILFVEVSVLHTKVEVGDLS